MDQLEDLLKALLKNGLKIPQRNANCSELTYNTWLTKYLYKNKRVCVKPLRSRLEAIQKLQPPSTVKGCRCFPVMVNFLSMFCPELQKTVKTNI